jgi:hypothetical protein
LSTATAESNDSTLATKAMVSTAVKMSRGAPCGIAGRISSFKGAFGRSTRVTSTTKIAASAVTVTTATNGAGTTFTFGRRGQPSRMTTVRIPTSTEPA